MFLTIEMFFVRLSVHNSILSKILMLSLEFLVGLHWLFLHRSL